MTLKTIKELEDAPIDFKLGYKCCKKDVVKVIDELSYRDTEEDLRINVDKLKAIITGAN